MRLFPGGYVRRSAIRRRVYVLHALAGIEWLVKTLSIAVGTLCVIALSFFIAFVLACRLCL